MTFTVKQLLLLPAVLVSSTVAFQPVAGVTSRCVSVLAASPNLVVVPEENNQGITPSQIKTLRKEASKRRSRKQLVQQTYAGEEEYSSFLSAVCEDLENSELCEVRGVSKNDKRLVYDTANQLAYDMSVELQREVTVVSVKGHTLTLFCASSDKSKRKIVLRTSYQEGAWDKRDKAPRDHRGQIIKD